MSSTFLKSTSKWLIASLMMAAPFCLSAEANLNNQLETTDTVLRAKNLSKQVKVNEKLQKQLVSAFGKLTTDIYYNDLLETWGGNFATPNNLISDDVTAILVILSSFDPLSAVLFQQELQQFAERSFNFIFAYNNRCNFPDNVPEVRSEWFSAARLAADYLINNSKNIDPIKTRVLFNQWTQAFIDIIENNAATCPPPTSLAPTDAVAADDALQVARGLSFQIAVLVAQVFTELKQSQ